MPATDPQHATTVQTLRKLLERARRMEKLLDGCQPYQDDAAEFAASIERAIIIFEGGESC